MQNKPFLPVSYLQLKLDPDFPFSVSELFTQKDRQITALHFHDFTELGLCLKGSGIFVVENKVLPFKEGDIIFITKHERHLAQSLAGTTSKWHWIYFEAEKLLCPSFMNTKIADFSRFKGEDFRNIISPASNQKLCGYIRELIETGKSSEIFKKQKILGLLCLFVVEMHSFFSNLEENVSEDEDYIAEPDTLSRLNKSLVHLTGHYREKIDFSKLHSLCGMSPTNFRRLFKKTLGKSPRAYLNSIRVAMAIAELEGSSRTVSDIALDCGFETISCFNRMFKSSTGMPPRQWRRETKKM